MNKKSMEIKKKHHFVWAHYLKQWAIGDNVWYKSSKGGNIRNDSIYGRSQESEFYKVTPLSKDDIDFIRLFPTSDSPNLQKFHESQLEFFKKVTILIDAPIIWKDIDGIDELVQISNWAANNSLENTHTAIESLAKPVMEELWKGNSDCLKTKSNMVKFCNYLGHQLARTKKIKAGTFAGMREANKDNPLWIESSELFEKNWWFISYKVGINFGHSLIQSATTTNHIFIRNTTNIDFITSDFPVINVHQCTQDSSQNKIVDKLDLYYPLSPKLAYMMNDSQHYNHLSNFINEEDVIKLNLLMANNSHENIYGSSEQALKDVRKSYRNLKI